jgi:hypothetical protein
MRSVRTTLPPRAGRPIRPRVRVTRRARKLTDQERREIEARLCAEGRLGREVR